MPTRLGISGFGRIGRNLLRIGYDHPDLEFVAISDVADLESLAYLLAHGTIEGPFPAPVAVEGNALRIGERRIRYIRNSTPGVIPWDVLGADVVLECTGRFRRRAELQRHLDAGAGKVLLSTPPLDDIDRTIINGINDDKLQPTDRIVSNGSSSAHALALVLKVLSDAVEVEWAFMTTVHAFTGDQTLSDTAQPGPRWSRSAAKNIIPNPSWAPRAVEQMLPQLAGRLQGLALNVPVMVGSNIDLVTGLNAPPSVDEINTMMRDASTGAYAGLLDYTEEPIVSSDVKGNLASAVFDASATMALGGGIVKTLTWFDNGWAYAARMLDLARAMAEN